MNKAAVLTLLDHMYWVNRRILDAASTLPPDELTSDGPTPRDLKATLVHELDVEWSWRLAAQGRPIEELGPEQELRADDYPDVPAIREHWERDEAEMRRWVESLTDADLAADVHPVLSDRARPLWQFLMHIVMHAAQQQADAAALLSARGRSPGEIGFLEYLRSTGR